MTRICVLGLGYMGLPLALLFSNAGHKVVGVDINPSRVDDVKQGICPFDEKGLPELLRDATTKNNLSVSTKIEKADIFIISVPTPHINQKSDLSFVKSATEMIATVLEDGNLVVLESTVPPNTSKKLIKPALDKTSKKYYLAHCPERAIPGNTLYELVNNDRVVGGIDNASAEITKKVYGSFVKGSMYITDITTAETCKLMENTFRDVNIALANEFAKISEEVGINVWEAINLANRHPRVHIHQPGPGVGGHCIAVDPLFLIEVSKNAVLIETARKINDYMPYYVAKMVERYVKPGATISILGVAYKKDVDDSRETPALEIIKLLGKNYKLKITDPFVRHFEYKLVSLEEALENSNCAVIVTDHDEYKNTNILKFNSLKEKLLIDTRNCIDKSKLEKAGFKVKILGDNK